MSPKNPNSVPPPRALNAQKFAESRAPELESLHSVISNRLNHDFKITRNKRRRTNSFYRKRKHFKSGSVSDQNSKPKRSRRVRRRQELQDNPESGFVKCRDGTKRLRTHLWHAKRFTMVKKWGYYLPLGLHGRGRGSRAVLKWLKSNALVHDVSYYHLIQLAGPEDSILMSLRMVLLPMNSTIPEEISQSAEYGTCSKNGMLYRVGAPLSQFIAPVSYMWCPSLYENFVHNEQGHVKSSISAKQESITPHRQLWIWIHAASFEEGLDALRTACQKQMHESGDSVSCVSLDGRITKLEVTGSKAIQILQKTLHPTPETKYEPIHRLSKCSNLTACTSSEVQKPFLSNAVDLPFGSVVSMTVSDPRDFHPRKSYADLESSRKQIDLSENDTLASWSNSGKKAVHVSENLQLWDSTANLIPPLPEKIVCTDRHQQHLKDFYLDSDTGEELASEARDGFGRSCPILLLKHATQDNFITRWSIVIPLSWTKVFWLSLLSHGAHAIGLRERRWIACDSVLPYFPYDFPDSKAYSSLMSDEATSSKNHVEIHPPAVRPLNIPVPPPWHCIESTCNSLLEMNGISDKQPCDASPSHPSETLFNGFVARQLEVLRDNLISNPDQMASKNGLFFVRVLVRAFKEGAFEDGAVICAPVLADLPLWKFRSEDMDKLQIPQSVIKSYFMQQESGKWDLQLPHNCPDQESYRWPIGFITTGFIRGSKKPRAIGFCEAKLLAQLRKQQLTVDSESRSEIRVLVRNMRSTVYRRAYANIVIEGAKDDAEFL